MIIIIKGKRKLTLSLPSGLALNPLTASILPMYLRKYDVRITGAQARKFVRELNRYRRTHPEWSLVEVLSSTGDGGRIWL